LTKNKNIPESSDADLEFITPYKGCFASHFIRDFVNIFRKKMKSTESARVKTYSSRLVSQIVAETCFNLL